MNKLIIITGITAIYAAGTVAAADDRSTETRAGFGSGAIIGAVVGGPAGAIIGSAAGAIIVSESIRQRMPNGWKLNWVRHAVT